MSSLRDWLVSAAGLKGERLEIALSIIDEEFIETIDELQELHTQGRLGQVFKQRGILLAIEAAIKKGESTGGASNQSLVAVGSAGAGSMMLPIATVVAVDMAQPTTPNPLLQQAPTAEEEDGTHFFRVKTVSGAENILAASSLPCMLIAAFNSDGLQFLDENRKILKSFGYADLHRWGDVEEGGSQFSLVIWNADTQDSFELVLTTSQAADMEALILDFCTKAAKEMAEEKEKAEEVADVELVDAKSSPNSCCAIA